MLSQAAGGFNAQVTKNRRGNGSAADVHYGYAPCMAAAHARGRCDPWDRVVGQANKAREAPPVWKALPYFWS
jgi:hypothetical protein